MPRVVKPFEGAPVDDEPDKSLIPGTVEWAKRKLQENIDAAHALYERRLAKIADTAAKQLAKPPKPDLKQRNSEIVSMREQGTKSAAWRRFRLSPDYVGNICRSAQRPGVRLR